VFLLLDFRHLLGHRRRQRNSKGVCSSHTSVTCCD
jgi:hypothetical protein